MQENESQGSQISQGFWVTATQTVIVGIGELMYAEEGKTLPSLESVRCSVMLTIAGVQKCTWLGFMFLGGSTCKSSPSPFDRCCVIGKSWLVGGNWQLTKLQRNFGGEIKAGKCLKFISGKLYEFCMRNMIWYCSPLFYVSAFI